MLEEKVKLLSEGLARTMGRRKFLSSTGATLFSGLAALAAGHAMLGRASAQSVGGDTVVAPWPPYCAPPGPYCNITGQSDNSGCNGAHCFRHLYNGQMLQCSISYHWYPRVGCWTVFYQPHDGYWTCCDCSCANEVAYCGCAQYTGSQGTPPPQPDSPVGSK